MAQGSPAGRAWELPSWKTALGWCCAVALSAAFLVSGFWKLVDPLGTETRMVQALVWPQLALWAALGVGLAEAWTGVLLLVPRWRQWGAWLAAFLLIVFMLYMGWNYNALQGEDCSCFPWLKRVVGPGFFIGDTIMLLMALAAGLWIRKPGQWRNALLVLLVLVVFSGAMYGVARTQLTGLEAPASVLVDGKPFPLHHGKVLLYFYDPMCAHCFRVAKQMSTWNWAPGVRIVAVATENRDYAPGFLADTGLAGKAKSSTEDASLRKVFQFGDPPYAVALEFGRQKESYGVFEDTRYVDGLKRLGFLE